MDKQKNNIEAGNTSAPPTPKKPWDPMTFRLPGSPPPSTATPNQLPATIPSGKNEQQSPPVSSAPPPQQEPTDSRNIKVYSTPQAIQPDTPPSNIITVVHDPNNTLGKKFNLNADGKISKKAAVSVSLATAVMHQVDTFKELASLYVKVGNDPHKAIINGSFEGIEIGEEFIILSANEIEKRYGIPRTDRDKQKGVNQLTYNEKTYKAVGRFKENIRPSCWQYADWDIDKHTPEEFRNQNFDERLSTLAKIIPGLLDASYCWVPSTSARVYHNGKPVGGGNGHLWFKVKNPEDVERFRAALMIATAIKGLTWKKPRYSRKEPGKIVGYSLTTIIDLSVLMLGRLTFAGKPTVGDGLTVKPLSGITHIGKNDSIDTSLVTLPDKETTREITRKAGVAMEVSQGENGLRIIVNNLTLDIELETNDHGLLTVREILERGITDKIRCQTPFRESSSYAAFVSKGKDGTPFVHDSGTSTTHWLIDSDKNELEIIFATGVIKGVLEKAKDDVGVPFEPEALQALIVIKQQQPAEYQRIRTKLKSLNRNISVVELDKSVKKQSKLDANGEDVPETHNGYAKDLIVKLTIGKNSPAGHGGSLFVLNPSDNLWIMYQSEKLVCEVADLHDGKENCKRSSDYSGIANHAIMRASKDDFFADAPTGLACPDGFYQIVDNEIKIEPLAPSHRQRVKIGVTPLQQETPMFDAFLHETFQSEIPGEEEQQLMLVQEIAGAIMIGIMAKFQKAALFYDPFGRAGKGTLERMFRALVPSPFVTAVSPFSWNQEYYILALAGSRFNVVGELPASKAIPAAAFKTVTGGDLLTGRNPSGRPISFKNEAAHLFMSNHFITTSDHSGAFFDRWLLVEFPNSRLRSGLPLDPGLADRIIEQELAGVAYWALIGAKRLLAQGKFSSSIVHDRLMDKWRRTTNSLEEFIHECCELNTEYSVRRSDLYQHYKSWCGENGRRPFAKGKVKELLDNNIGLGVSHAKLDGYEIFRGIQMKKTESDFTSIGPLK